MMQMSLKALSSWHWACSKSITFRSEWTFDRVMEERGGLNGCFLILLWILPRLLLFLGWSSSGRMAAGLVLHSKEAWAIKLAIVNRILYIPKMPQDGATGRSFKKIYYFSHTLHSCSTSIYTLLKRSVLVPVSLSPPFWKAQFAPIGQFPQAYAGPTHQLSTCSGVFLISSTGIWEQR